MERILADAADKTAMCVLWGRLERTSRSPHQQSIGITMQVKQTPSYVLRSKSHNAHDDLVIFVDQQRNTTCNKSI
jgi:hypothetical protein